MADVTPLPRIEITPMQTMLGGTNYRADAFHPAGPYMAGPMYGADPQLLRRMLMQAILQQAGK